MKRKFATLILILSFAGICPISGTGADSIAISQLEFRQLIIGLSEPEGYFDSDNFISNERAYLKILPDLRRLDVRGGAYIGIGPDQNYSYIAAVRPHLAFILDIRRQNALQHLYFKSLFQLSTTRAKFLERLFGRKLAAAQMPLGTDGISELLRYIDQSPVDAAFKKEKESEAILAMRSWDIGISEADCSVVQRIARAFMDNGPDLKFSSFNRAPRAYYPSYRQLLEETDSAGIQSNYLADEAAFQCIKKMHRENRIVPVVGDLAGSSAMKRIGDELRRRNLALACIYVSNVEFYLFGRENWSSYLNNLGRFPREQNACLIRSYANFQPLLSTRSSDYYMGAIVESLQSFLNDESSGKNKSYQDLVNHGLAIR
jgi:hypothetical protein